MFSLNSLEISCPAYKINFIEGAFICFRSKEEAISCVTADGRIKLSTLKHSDCNNMYIINDRTFIVYGHHFNCFFLIKLSQT